MIYNSQSEYDDALPDDDAVADAIDADCHTFAEEARDGRLSPNDFHEWAQQSTIIADMLGEDSDCELLQLIIKASQVSETAAFAEPFMAEIYSDAYDFKERAIKEQIKEQENDF